jgi:hypothetical protein
MNDFIQVIDVLTPEEVSKVLSLIQHDKFHATTIFSEAGEIVNSSIRSNSRWCLDESLEIAQIIHEGMNRGLIRYHEQLRIANPRFDQFPIPMSSWTKCWREVIQLLKYNEGEHYGWHYDQAYKREDHEYFRTISIVLYLQNAEEGGRTLFSHRGYKPKPGQALYFPSNWCYPHEAEKIYKGTKIAAVSWYYSQFES